MESSIHLAVQHLSLLPPHDATEGSDPELPTSEEGVGFKLSYSRSVELVVGAAKEYFNSAASLMDTDMDLARYIGRDVRLCCLVRAMVAGVGSLD